MTRISSIRSSCCRSSSRTESASRPTAQGPAGWKYRWVGPAKAVSGGINWKGEKWTVTVAGGWHSGWPSTETELLTTDPEPIAIAGPRNNEELGDFKTLDFRISRDYQFAASSMTAFFEVSNILGRENDCCVEYELTDEDEGGDLILDTETNNYLPAIPSIGVIWRF